MEITSEKTLFSRDSCLKKAKEIPQWDVIVIGGGATGLGVALDAANRGFSTLLLEQSDFAKGTSSRSTKLVHGGVRYLAQGDIQLVREALHERGVLLRNAPHLVKKQAFIIPCYTWWDQFKYLTGLKLYDWLSGRSSFGSSRRMNGAGVSQALPGVRSAGLKGGIKYFDGQFDDSRLAINLAQTCVEEGGVLLNYFRVTGLLKNQQGKLSGVTARDEEDGIEYNFKAKAVINATGVFVDQILRLDTPSARPLVRPSQGIHVVLDKSFLRGEDALMIPQTKDGRVLFAVPWHEFTLVGTTDTPLTSASLEPEALEQEIDFVLQTAGNYLERKPSRADMLSVFAGLRPLAAPEKDTGSTKEISRSHKLIVSGTGLITITGGKWTTYRQMAEETVNKAIETASLEKAPCTTTSLKIHGYLSPGEQAASGAENEEASLSIYGSDAALIHKLSREKPGTAEKLHSNFPYIKAQVTWAVRHEMARTVEDILARRIRVLFLDAKAAIDMAPEVSRLMAEELQKDAEWEKAQVETFTSMAIRYLPGSHHGKVLA
ncbi:glycerol-3-phosphate dehydrogenase [Anseongella ginsenosidimutans]|uniref:Glycerol-3-phosphate dehydrogenase n=1 Tax=Anseongella ginsenosidimutans TaxID=496056 RepID=A0A4R3KUH4_9SPHI|nr:glycerol-3-phosphate dehydrogenase/oxidase [Anseongella ginsenosidimutans]QEC51607.1 glycerol-3-phosphate dehydrogenase/oxidase [Anseongella ginsenosidimutans]TCS88935.1 glycerol-3-phosphate dehydrogenase [Anseongella ginsenosidimutans]